MANEKKPNFFIVGAARAGTTTLWRSLKKNPEVFMPGDEIFKEPAFFSDKGSALSLEEYLDIFSDARERHKLVGEASTSYLACPESAERIHGHNPAAKIIIVLRNPVDRAYSLYNWMVQEGYEYVSNFEGALKKEEYRKKKCIPNFFEPEYYWNYMYVGSGRYYAQVRRYKELFGDTVLVIKFDDLIFRFEETYEGICDFLRIKRNPVEMELHNVSKSVHLPFFSFVLRKAESITTAFMRCVAGDSWHRKTTRDVLLCLGVKNCKPKPMRSGTRKKIMYAYKDDLQRLSQLVPFSIEDWLVEK